jgi:hypothetical protein
MLDAEISAKIAIFEGFRGPNFSLPKMVPERAQYVPKAIP